MKALLSRRADNGNRMVISLDSDAAESGLRELAVEPELKNEAVEGRVSFSWAWGTVEVDGSAVPGLPDISDN